MRWYQLHKCTISVHCTFAVQQQAATAGTIRLIELNMASAMIGLKMMAREVMQQQQQVLNCLWQLDATHQHLLFENAEKFWDTTMKSHDYCY